MKKTLLFTVSALLLCGSLQARKWDFTNWSSTTYSNLMAGAFENCNNINPASGWSDVEKKDGTAPTAESKANCFWEVTQQGTAEGATLVANGETIAELEGLKWVHTNAQRNLAIAVNYPSTSLGSYQGPSYLWLGGSKKNYFYIPNVKLGTDITIGLESHKPAEARGIELYAGSGHNTSGKKLTDAEGNAVAPPTVYEEQTWRVPEDLTEGLNEDGTVDVLIYNTNGCHLYFINVEEGDDVPVVYNVAYVYDATYNGAKDGDGNPMGFLANGGLDNDPIYTTLLDNFTMTPIDVNSEDIKALTTEQFNDSMITFDAVVLSEAVASGNTYAKGMVDIINKVPMVNFKSFMYKNKVWSVGAGVNPTPKATAIKVGEDYMDSKLFEGLEMDEEGNVELFISNEVAGGNLVQAFSANAGGLFADDEILATVANGEGFANAIHVHSTRNQYILLPLSSDNLCLGGDWNVTDNATKLAENAVKMAAATKAKVLPASKPFFTQENKDGVTTVTITCSTSGSKIYYTLDGTDPTEASPVYSAAFDVTVDSTVVKAFATAQGYEPSEIASATIQVKTQTATPHLASADSEGFTTITISASEGDSIYFNFFGGTDKATSQHYTEPIVLTEPATLTALAIGEGQLPSVAVTRTYSVGGIPAVKDTIAHFTANENDWFTNVKLYNSEMVEQELPTSNWAAKTAYYFGKSAWSYYSTTEVDHTEPVFEEDGVTPVKNVKGEDSIRTVYKVDPTTVKYVYSTSDTQWRMRTQGQVLTGETTESATAGVGKGATGYYAETAFDAIGLPSKGKLTFGGKKDGEKASASVESTVKFEGELDVVTYLTNGGTSAIGVELQKSTDGETWETVGALGSAATQRYYKKNRFHISATEPVYLRVAHVSGGSKGQLYDIYVITTDGLSGIESLASDAVAKTSVAYDLQGRQVTKLVPGQLYIQNNKKVIVR